MSQPNLNEDLNIVSNSDLTITYLDGNLDIIQQLDDEPNDVGGLTAAELKAKFDEAGNIIKTYINETLIPEILAADATEEARAAAETQRETNEAQRIENENTRIAAEQSRASAETARDTAEQTREAAEQARADETSGIVARATEQADLASSAATSAVNSADAAGLSATAASESASAAQESAASASQERAIATSAASQASSAASIASEQKSQAQAAASNADKFATQARQHMDSARTYYEMAGTSANNAAQSAASASTSEANAKASETAAKASETTAKSEADRAKSEADRAAGIVGGDYATKTDLAAHTDDTDIHVTAEEKSAWNAKADAPFKPAGKSYLTFSSPNSFTLAVGDATKHWGGTLEYFASDKTWTVWDGTTTLSSVDNDGDNVLYLRGTGNTKITYYDEYHEAYIGWTISGTDVRCNGNIETLLDYATVETGQHPGMEENCFGGLFQGCTALTQAPDLPATTLANSCYIAMFYNCTSLTKAPALHATTLANSCYGSMFQGCTALTQAPALPATTLAGYCYRSMFRGCTALTQAPALPATTLAEYCYRTMFQGCTGLKLSSTKTGEYTQEYRILSSGTGTTATNALTDMFLGTGGTFTGTPEVNTTYYLSSDNMVVRETEIATLKGYIKSMIDAAIANAIGG